MKKKSTPMRMCVGCGEMKTKKEMVRIVLSPTGEMSIDESGKKPGRGAYICPLETCFEQAYKAKRLDRSFKQSVSSEVYELLREQLKS